MADYLGLLIIHQDLTGYPAEVFETLDQAFVGVFGVLAGHRYEMKAARIAQGVDREMHFLRAAGRQRAVFSPVVLQLLARRGLEAHRRPRLAQRSLGPDVIAQDARLPAVTLLLDLAQNYRCVPHSRGQQPIDHRFVPIQLALAGSGPLTRRRTASF